MIIGRSSSRSALLVVGVDEEGIRRPGDQGLDRESDLLILPVIMGQVPDQLLSSRVIDFQDKRLLQSSVVSSRAGDQDGVR